MKLNKIQTPSFLLGSALNLPPPEYNLIFKILGKILNTNKIPLENSFLYSNSP